METFTTPVNRTDLRYVYATGKLVHSHLLRLFLLTPLTLQVEYNRLKMEVDARLRKAVIPNLQPDTSYDFKITAPEGNMGGLRHRISAKTSPPITIRRPEIDHARDTETTVTIILPSLENRSPVK